MALIVPSFYLANKICSPKVLLNSLYTFKRIRLIGHPKRANQDFTIK